MGLFSVIVTTNGSFAALDQTLRVPTPTLYSAHSTVCTRARPSYWTLVCVGVWLSSQHLITLLMTLQGCLLSIQQPLRLGG